MLRHCTCSYLLPVINHYLLYFGLARCQRAEGLYRMPTHPFWHRNGEDCSCPLNSKQRSRPPVPSSASGQGIM